MTVSKELSEQVVTKVSQTLPFRLVASYSLSSSEPRLVQT